MVRTPQRVAFTILAAVSMLALQSQSPVFAQNADDLTVPDPVAVSLAPSTTTWLAIDFLQSNCAPTPACVATLPAMAQALEAARAAKAHVVYSVHAPPDNMILPDVAPMPNEPIFVAIPGDKFFDSDLDQILKQAGTTTLVLTGFSSNSGVLYTAAAATQRGYTVVVAEDGIAGPTDLATPVALWQMIHAPSPNVDNAPLQAKAVTLSRTDLITYH